MEAFLAAQLADDFARYRGSGEDERLRERLVRWSARVDQKETTVEGELLDVFFRQVWGYWGASARSKADGYSLWPKCPIGGAGQSGRTGQADLALAPQRRKGNDRSPVKQAADYLKEA